MSRRRAAAAARRLAAAACLGLLLLAGCGEPPTRAPRRPARVPGVKLLLVVVVDQLGWDTLQRYRPALRGGLARLMDEGVVFRQCYHRHSETATAPGHATLVTGMVPRHHGIVANDWFDRTSRRQVAASEDVRGMPSPANLLVTGLGDWARQRDPWGKSFAAAGKVDAAVMLGAKHPDGVFWYDPRLGVFTSSKAYPPFGVWVKRFGRQPVLSSLFGGLWRPLPLPPRVDAGALGVLQLQGPMVEPPFPHAFGGATTRIDDRFFGAVFDTPAIDGYLASFARDLVYRQRLGEDNHLDYLALSFSAVDSVGHLYGPHSREVLDAVVRLDRVLGELLDYLEQHVGRDGMIVALSADHGVAPMPERQRRLGLPGTRATAVHVACVQAVTRVLDRTYGRRDWFVDRFYLDPVAVAASRVPRADIDRTVVRALSACPDVAHVWTRAQMLPDAPTRNRALALYRASFHPARSADFALQWQPWFVERPSGTEHKSVYEYDTHVPLVLRVPGVAPRAVDTPVAAADLAPTLAALLGLRPSTRLDGRDLSALFLGVPPPAPRPAALPRATVRPPAPSPTAPAPAEAATPVPAPAGAAMPSATPAATPPPA